MLALVEYFMFSISLFSIQHFFSLKHLQLDSLSCYFISSLYFKLISIVLLQVFNPGLFLCLCICFITDGIFSWQIQSCCLYFIFIADF